MDVDSYFQALRSEGELDSSGVFTFNPDKVEWTLSEYQLADSKEYSLFLVRAACAGGAASLSVTTSGIKKKVHAFRLPDYFFGLSDFHAAGRAGRRDPCLEPVGYILTAFSAASRLGRTEVCSASPQGEGLRARLGPSGKLEVEECSGLEPGTRLQLAPDQPHDPVTILHSRARWSNVPLSVFGSDLHRTVSPGDLTHLPSIVATGLGPGYRASPDMAKKVHLVFGFQESDASDVIFMSWSENGSPPLVTGVHRGIAYPMPDIVLPRGFQAVIRADDLKPDLSYQGLVRNENYETRGARLRGLVFRVLERVVDSDRVWTDTKLREIKQKLVFYWPVSHRTPSLERFMEANSGVFLPRDAESLERFLKHPNRSLARRYCRQYRNLALQARAAEKSQAADMIRLEGRMRQGLDLMDEDFRLFQLAFGMLYDLGQPVQADPSTGSAVDLLVETLTSGRRPGKAFIDRLPVHSSWREMLLFQKCLSEGGEELRDFFLRPRPAHLEFIYRVGKGEPRAALRLLEENSNPILTLHESFYRSLVLEFNRGQLSWTGVVKLSIRNSFGQDSQTLSLLTRAPREARTPRSLFLDHIFGNDFWPMAVYFALTMTREKNDGHFSLWSRVFLQFLLSTAGELPNLTQGQEKPLELPLFE